MKINVINEEYTRLLIAQNGYNLRGFSRKIGISHPYLSQVLNGNRNPSPIVATKVAKGLNKEMGDIFFIENGSNVTGVKEVANE